jgi:hypothetical protein
MRPLRSVPLPILLFVLPLAGCPTNPPSGDDDSAAGDDDTTAGDDDDDDDDSTPVEPPSWSFDRTELTAGKWEELSVSVENFVFDQEAAVIEGSEIILVDFQEVGANEFRFGLMPGLLSSGEQEFGITGVSGDLVQTFTVTGITPTPAPYTGAAATGTLGGEDSYHVYSLDAATIGQVLLARAGGLGNASLHPRMWLFAADGLEILGGWGGADGAGGYLEAIGAFTVTADGTFLLRVDDSDRAGGADFSYTLDLSLVTPPGEPTLVPEVEPNDAPEQWQSLGALGLGSWEVTGECTEVGYDPKTLLATGDIEGFTFTVDVPTNIQLSLAWADAANDLDVVVFDATTPDFELSIDSPAVVNGDGYTLADPEVASFLAEPGVTYLLAVWEWEVDPSVWSLQITAIPIEF